ncbi:MAG TPA: ATP-binding protein [Chthoniobacteraceae bacterium]|nr:ATP-binding protein [Chthoniobacteraceae bacterium]
MADHLDTLCFAVVLLAGFSIKYGCLVRRDYRRFLWVDAVGLLLCLLCTWGLMVKLLERESRGIDTVMAQLLPLYAAELEEMEHARLPLALGRDDPAAAPFVQVYERWQHLNPMIEAFDTYRQLDNGELRRVMDPAARGEPLPPLPVEMVEAFDGNAGRDRLPARPPGTPFLRAWYPLRDVEGRVEAALLISFDASGWYQTMHQSRLRILGIMSVIALLLAASTSLLAGQEGYRLEKRESERALRRSQSRLALHLCQTPLAAIEWDLRFRVREWNPSAERIYGYSAKEALGKSCYELMARESDREKIEELQRELLENSELVRTRSTVMESRTRSGRTILCEYFHTVLIGADGEATGIATLCQDITERRRMEEKLRQSQKMKTIGNFAAMIAHDFNNILSIIQGHNDLILMTQRLPEEAARSAGEVGHAVRKASHLTRQLLTFSRRRELALEPVEVALLIEEVVHSTAPTLGAAITVKTGVAEGLPAIPGDAALLEQALVNLVLNARDAMPSGGTLFLKAALREIALEQAAPLGRAREGRFVEIAVQDTGSGIPLERQKEVFEPFFTTKSASSGTGLGLAAAYGTIQQHHGWIELTSAPGVGTTFCVVLPVSSEGFASA